MRIKLPVVSAAVLAWVGLFFFTAKGLAADSPKDRQPTDAKSISSLPNASAHPVPIEDLFYSRRVNSGSWSPDGKQIAFSTNLTGRFNLWKVPADSGWPIQLVVSDDRQSGEVWSPDGKWIVYEQDLGGGEIYDLMAVPNAGGTLANLTNTPEISEAGPIFSPDGQSIAFSYKPKTSPTSDIALLDWTVEWFDKYLKGEGGSPAGERGKL